VRAIHCTLLGDTEIHTRLLCRLMQEPGFRDAFYKSNGKGSWRVPAVNETCCVRTNLADLLDAIGAQVERTTNCIMFGYFFMQRPKPGSLCRMKRQASMNALL
jgi:hypothetical protein